MLFVIVGVLIIASNLAGVGWFADWTWEISGDLWKFCVPFVFATLWWIWSDKSGLDKRREIEKMEARKANRRQENLVSLGLNHRAQDGSRRKASAFQNARQRQIDKIEGKREQQRQRNRDSILSGFDGHSVSPGKADDSKS